MFQRFVLWILLLPLQLVLLGVFWLCEMIRFVRLLVGMFSGRQASDTIRRTDLCSIVVLNWNGRHLLEETLPALRRAVFLTQKEHEIIVVDNGSRDNSREWLQENYPQVRIVALEENVGFGEGNNRGVEIASHDIVVLLNNDMVVSQDFLSPLLEAFSDPQVFAVSSQIFFAEGKRPEETGNTRAQFKKGYLHLSHQPVESFYYSRKHLPVLWAGGGSSAFHRGRFLQLGGFSPLFSPCYGEDTDLSYRAWRRGWKVLLAAESKVQHKHRSSTGLRFNAEQLDQMIEERKLWYLWKNYQLGTLVSHFILFPLNLTQSLSMSDYLRALRKLPGVLQSRMSEPQRVITDRVLFRWIHQPLLYLNHIHPDRAHFSRHRQAPLRILIVSAYLPHLGRHGGAGRVFQLLIRIAKRYEVSLVTFVETPEELAELPQVIPHCKRVDTVYRREFTPVSLYPYEPFEEFNSSHFRKTLESVLCEMDFDLVHFEWAQMAQYADLFPHIPKLLTEIEVNYAAHYSQVKVESNFLRKVQKVYNTLQTFYRELEMCRRVDKVICVTNVDRDYLKGYVDAEKLSVVNTGVDTHYFDCDVKILPDPNALVFVGAFRHEPNVDAMLYFCREVFPLILSKRPQTHLYIVGASPPRSICEVDSHPNITVTGFLDDIREYYNKAQIVIVPLRTGAGIRGKILEAWAARKAIVATSLACVGIRACHGENILIGDSAEEFALWTDTLLQNPDYCKHLGQAGRKTAVQYYDWRLIGQEMITLYESQVDPSP